MRPNKYIASLGGIMLVIALMVVIYIGVFKL